MVNCSSSNAWELTSVTQHNGLDISLNMIPPNHPLLDPRQLEAEATGLLDRMLGVLQDNSRLRRPTPMCISQNQNRAC